MFYLVEANIEAGNVPTQGIFAYETVDSALVAFHQSVAYAMSNENVLKMSRCILDEQMQIPVRSETWTRPVEE